MNLIEIRYPARALSDDDRSSLAADMAVSLVGDETTTTAPQETLRRARAMLHVTFAELEGWATGDGPWRPGTPPPLLITLSVPERWRDEVARTEIGLLRHAVRRLDARHGWERSLGDLWINVIGIADGCIGLDGRASTGEQVGEVMVAEFQERLAAGEIDVDLPKGALMDPMCGMTVKLGKGAITLEHDGETMGFCAQACRDSYARREGIAVS